MNYEIFDSVWCHGSITTAVWSPRVFLLVTNVWWLAEDWRPLQRCRFLSFCQSLPSSTLPLSSSHLGLPVLWPVSSIQGDCWASSCFPHPKVQPGNSVLGVRLDSHGAGFVFYLWGTTILHCLMDMSEKHCFTHDCYLHYFSVISDRWVKSETCYSVLLRSRSHWLFLELTYIRKLFHLSCNVYVFLC